MQRDSVLNATAWVRVNVRKGILYSCGHLAPRGSPRRRPSRERPDQGETAPEFCSRLRTTRTVRAELIASESSRAFPAAGDRGLPRNPHRNAGCHKAKPVRRKAKDLARGDLPEQTHRAHAVDHRFQRKVAAPHASSAASTERGKKTWAIKPSSR